MSILNIAAWKERWTGTAVNTPYRDELELSTFDGFEEVLDLRAVLRKLFEDRENAVEETLEEGVEHESVEEEGNELWQEKQSLADLQPDAYVHLRLTNATRQIRLIRIHPEGSLTDIRCSMEIHDMDDMRELYTAVSYTWGDSEKIVVIRIDGLTLEVNFNCWYALTRMKAGERHMPELTTLYWIDAVCIDQVHHAEKGIQVAQMGRIFSNAIEVAAVVGDEDVEKRLCSHMSCLDLLDPPGTDGMSDLCDQIQTVEGTKVAKWAELTILSISHDVSFALDFLLGLPYFNRLWTVQECKLAQQLRLYFGRSCLPWPEMMQWLRQNRSVPSRRDRFRGLRIQEKVNLFISEVWPMLHVPTEHLPELIVRFRGRECFDARDKIYGLVSLAMPSTTWRPLDIRYDVSQPHVLLDYIQAHTSGPLIASTGARFRTTRLADGRISTPLPDYVNAISFASFWHSIRILLHSFYAADSGFSGETAAMLDRHTLAPSRKVEADPSVYKHSKICIGSSGCLVQRIIHIDQQTRLAFTIAPQASRSPIEGGTQTKNIKKPVRSYYAWRVPRFSRIGDHLVSLPSTPKRHPLALVAKQVFTKSDDTLLVTGSAHLRAPRTGGAEWSDSYELADQDCEFFLHPRMLLRWALLSMYHTYIDDAALCDFEAPTCLELPLADTEAYSFIELKKAAKSDEDA